MVKSELGKEQERVCGQCGCALPVGPNLLGGSDRVSTCSECAADESNQNELVELPIVELPIVELEQTPLEMRASETAREASVSLRAPPPPCRLSQPARSARRDVQETPPLVLVLPEPALEAEAAYAPLDQGSLMPVSWEDNSGVLQVTKRSPGRSLAPPLPPRPSRKPKPVPSSQHLLGEMGGLALSLPSDELSISLSPIAARSRRNVKGRRLLLCAGVLLFLGTFAGMTFVNQQQKAAVSQSAALPLPPLEKVTQDPPTRLSQPPQEEEKLGEVESPQEPKPLKVAAVVKKRPPVKVRQVQRPARVVSQPPKKVPAPIADSSSQEPQVRKFDIRALKSGVNDVVGQIGSCRRPGDPSGIAKVVMVFSTSGRVTSATVSGQPFAGTATGGCIARRFRSLRLPAFDGERRTIRKTVVVQ